MSQRSPLVWTGGKSHLAKTIISLFPKHRCYVEVFGGGANVLIQKPRSPVEVYNDINGDVVNFFEVLRNSPEELQRHCYLTPYSRSLFQKWRTESYPENKLEWATRFFYMNRSGLSGQGVNSKFGTRPGWSFSKERSAATKYMSGIRQMEEVAQRFLGVQIECKDFRYILEAYDGPETIFYCDPPYVGLESYYAGGFNEQDHRALADILSNIQGKAIISYYPHQLVDELYRDWIREEISVLKHAEKFTSKTAKTTRDAATELLLMNFERQLTLW